MNEPFTRCLFFAFAGQEILISPLKESGYFYVYSFSTPASISLTKQAIRLQPSTMLLRLVA